jgi:hypothetical protein
MVEKIGHIKNPLTVIAIFAALAEVSGTVVLPFLDKETQHVYVWFPGRRNYYDADGEVRALDEANGRTLFKGPVEPGYSGGPVLDDRGYVVGVVWGGVLDRREINHFIPINHATNLLRLAGQKR